MCLAGDGGGKGRFKIRKGVEVTLELAGEPLYEAGNGLGR